MSVQEAPEPGYVKIATEMAAASYAEGMQPDGDDDSTPTRLNVGDLDSDEKDAIINGVLDILFPKGGTRKTCLPLSGSSGRDLNHEHSTDQTSEIHCLLDEYHLVH